MGNFQKHLEANLVAEWKEMYCNYKQLKRDVEDLKNCDLSESLPHVQPQAIETPSGSPYANFRKHVESPLWALSSRGRKVQRLDDFMTVHRSGHRQEEGGLPNSDEEEYYHTELLGPSSLGTDAKVFFRDLDSQLNKVNTFYKQKEKEYLLQARELQSQMETLLELQIKGQKSLESALKSAKPIKDLEGSLDKRNDNLEAGSKSKVANAKKMLKLAFAEVYRSLCLLKNFRSLNMMAFEKILKKYDKETGQNASKIYLQAVETSHLATSEKVLKLMDRIEFLVTEYFCKGHRKRAMKDLRPRARNSPAKTHFLLGLLTGSSSYLLIAFVFLLVSPKDYKFPERTAFMRSTFPVFSTLALFVLHTHMYSLNIYLWRRVRVNYSFIFEFASGTELRLQDLLIISTGLTAILIGGMVLHITTFETPHFPKEIFPLIVLVVIVGLTILPFNILYKKARFAFLRSLRNILFSPFYKVVLADFFMADQLTSQVVALSNLAYVSCYFFGGYFKTRDNSSCTTTHASLVFRYVLSMLPFWCRVMQCLRRYLDEHDYEHLVNAGKYFTTMVALAIRLTYITESTGALLALSIFSSVLATSYQLYWDIVWDWGLLQKNSRNAWLRDRLILKHKSTYFISMIVNLILRLLWAFSLIHLNKQAINHDVLDFLLASIEVVRRGLWNFYRMENEHLNNVGKFRATRTVPLPFKDLDDM
ncbi:hypothetical protein O6H91_17G063800 [Diphasiastrum complanatum]|uniref:Uncharacterized protein n=1 Tax=Diphasiastrum complanatum TaxID=34168 RepID=A0ACC2B7I3_DIPCM|nr:hypothetical protein O6H91_17G063800 [Diphasiastrum complanatum]